MRSVTVHGVDVPALGLGTVRMEGEECRSAVETALEMGYRHVDTAQLYDNEDAVGDGISDADVDREEVFLTTKIHWDELAYDDVLDSFERSLDRLGQEYVDLLLIHAPNDDVPVAETLDAMNRLHDDGSVEHVGVSNFSIEQTEAAIEASETPILTNQVEYHPYHDQSELLPWCVENDVLLTAYSPLDVGDVVGDETLAAIGERYDKSATQVALRWLVQQPMVAAVPKASSEAHLRENLNVFDFELTDDEMERIFEHRSGLTGRLRGLLGL